MSEVEQDILSELVDMPVLEHPVDVPLEHVPVPEPTVEDVLVEILVTEPQVMDEPVHEPTVDESVENVYEPPVEDVSVPEPQVEDIPVEILVTEPQVMDEPVPEPQVMDEPVPEPTVDEPVENVYEPPVEDIPVEHVPEPTVEDIPVEHVPEPTVEDEDVLVEHVPEPQVMDEPIHEPTVDESVEDVSEQPVEEEPEVKLDEIYASNEEETPQIQSSENITAEISEVQTPQPTPISNTPSIVFIVPYRDREKHYKLFSSAMKDALVNSPPYQILYINQKDHRGFNRGAMKNIGFLAVKNMYPNDYQNITLVFNDIDTMPAKDTVLNYQTTRGVIKHFYGFDYTLGGIVSINASDFETINGFPNFWAWGYEDNLLQMRAKNAGIVIDRSVFYKIYDSHIIHLSDTPIRTVNRAEFDRFLQNTKEGINSIMDLNYSVNADTGFIDVLQFNTTVQETMEKRSEYDLRNGPAPFKEVVMKNRRVPRMKMHFNV